MIFCVALKALKGLATVNNKKTNTKKKDWLCFLYIPQIKGIKIWPG
jgi:hypothetical protein